MKCVVYDSDAMQCNTAPDEKGGVGLPNLKVRDRRGEVLERVKWGIG